MSKSKEPPKPPAGDGYEVGYGKPPVHSRFGAGNPGRPKGSRRKATQYTMAEVVTAAMTRRRKVKRGDEIVEMPTFDIMVERLVATATSGSVREAAAALRLIDKHLSHLLQPPPQQTMITYHRAPGSQVILPPAELWKTRS